MYFSILFDYRAVFFLYKAPVLFSDGIAYTLYCLLKNAF